ncbi:hypothetical protein [Streptomyces nanshensis]|uniref:Uncharacterized protein n=1 Tax=Streptomyces nanshensis TaxID=518642 RepID=A0A1E7L9S7_9ACTN|nr:hypothetical protein [Streptomyces nanshensis]OEV13002.1 hypothetical protein AN218_05695 [Streptomyces nanshensis]
MSRAVKRFLLIAAAVIALPLLVILVGAALYNIAHSPAELHELPSPGYPATEGVPSIALTAGPCPAV